MGKIKNRFINETIESKVNEIKVLYLGYFLQLSKIVQSVHTAATTYNKNRQEKC